MSLLPKISKLVRIPELLKHKREEEEQQRRKKRQNERDRNSKFIIDEVTISQTSKAYIEVDMPTKAPEVPDIIKEKSEGKGVKIDLRA